MTEIEKLFRDHADDVYHFLVYYTRQRDVEDLVQETFIKALRSIGHFEKRSSEKTWLITIARRVAIDESRRRRDLPLAQDDLAERTDSLAMDTTQQVIAKESADELMGQVHQLPEKQRDVMLLRGISELTTAEVADVLNMNRTSVYVTYHRALKKLKQNWGRTGGMTRET
ncbi:RNA polymerase sigma factor [Salisediminibacterium beveridgei]|uniref:RNA polymerase sigma factor n=1 Tax=Salisediminibacterium beveridgei TaxID=632773 RepID=A0A1D7QZF8_9BACI|nr:RNA polymerase sigma factor [Salisediminibacterium beveridgei]AOM84340.1 RNA polymerase sigma factor sigX [Salisediminibacterium beveridgei]